MSVNIDQTRLLHKSLNLEGGLIIWVHVLVFSGEVSEVVLSGVGLRGLTWLASDAGFSVLSPVLA